MTTQRFPFRFTQAYRLAALPFGVREGAAEVVVGGTELVARYGPWTVRTPLANVTSTERTGPYAFPKTAGPAHLSLADRGITFASNGEAGLCLAFREPVAGIEPTGRLRHPNLTVTVADLDGLATALGHPVGR